MPGNRRAEYRQAGLRMALVETVCETFTGVMLPLGNPTAILAGGLWRGQCPFRILPYAAHFDAGHLPGRELANSSYSIGFSADSHDAFGQPILPTFHVVDGLAGANRG
jgi:hypothetical protein